MRLLRFVSAVALSTSLVVAACGDDEKSPAEIAAEANADVLCERLFSCCTPNELDALPFVDEKKPPTREGCVAYHAKTATSFLALTDRAAAAGRVAVHLDRSAACVEKLRAETCSEFHRRLPKLHLGDAYGLCNPDVVEPRVEDGQSCTLYLDCKGGFCETPGGGAGDGGAETDGTCKSLPKAGERCVIDGCAPGFRCDPETTLCEAYREAGEDCVDDNACASGACRGGKCVSPGRCGG